jgi:hypothetical protein
MASTLTVRNLAALVDRPERGLGMWIHERFVDIGGVELELPRRDEPARAAELPR